MTPRLAAKTDENQQKIMDELREIGFSVFDTHSLGRGFPDIIVGIGAWIGACYQGDNYLFEIKMPGKKNNLTKAERNFRDTWQGQVHVITCTEEALDIMEKI